MKTNEPSKTWEERFLKCSPIGNEDDNTYVIEFIRELLSAKDKEIEAAYTRGYQEASEKAGFHFINEFISAEKEKAREEERMLVYKELDIIKEGNLVRRLISNELKSLNWPEERKQSEIELSIAKHNFSSAGIDLGFNFCLSEMKQSVTDRIKELEK